MFAIKLWSLFSNNWIAKWLSIALVGITAYWTHNTLIKRHAVKAFLSDSKKEGQKKNEKSKNIRKNASKPGAFNRLLSSDCRDCN